MSIRVTEAWKGYK